MRTSICALVLVVGALATSAAAAEEGKLNQPPAGFTAVFNGQDLAGWYGMESVSPDAIAALTAEERAKKKAADTEAAFKHWRVENGELINDGFGPYLTTEKDYGDIELMIDYKTVPKADSGIYLRGTPQVQIWDYTEKEKFGIGADKGSGGLWNNSPGTAGKDPLVRADKPFGEWNRFRIRQIGARTTVYLNDQLVVDNAIMENYWDRQRPLKLTGPVQLQTHGGEIRWRNIFVREIPPAEVNQLLQKRDDQGFVSVFNGRDLTGWQGALDNYEVLDGAIRCQPHKGGTLYTQEQYGDFVARLEFRLPPAGNNGLAIRFPGTGDPAYAGMCELQVLDTPGYPGQLDPRQVHGSAYGMVAAQTGYLRPVGEWNFQEVTVQGSKIKVELNGTVILDADLSQVKELMANSPHPGKELTKGHFGFAGHSDPVEFRNICLKPL
ncbi:MAG: 3-keto-disaccharide hydrolase [Pirellulaceae bacterium]